MSTTTDQKPAQKRKKTKKIIPQKLGEDEIDKTPPLPGFNLAGRPESLKTKEGGLKRNEIKAVGPYHTNNVNTDTYWHFVIRSSKNEWIRFKPD